ncbi:MAG: NADH:ubiquinone oxidoreductase subunit NDUFA12 [Alphaproteobacteria bacterium]
MKQLLQMLFTWWNRQTLGTRVWTWRKGESVGSDEAGNQYYRERGGARRWVIYAGLADGSAVPAGWHGWLHHRVDDPPGAYEPHAWEQPHQANMTGTGAAYRPPGSVLQAAPKSPARPDYEAWSPE